MPPLKTMKKYNKTFVNFRYYLLLNFSLKLSRAEWLKKEVPTKYNINVDFLKVV